jgi:hypothetical protein
MIYLKINEDQSITYPFSITQLRKDNPNTSFPENINIETLLEYNIHQVIEVARDTNYLKNYTETLPILIYGVYYQNWDITDATEEEINQRIESQWSQIRSIRNQYLSDCDWTQLSDSPLTAEQKTAWATYRQELRDITLQEDPFNIVWPTKP